MDATLSINISRDEIVPEGQEERVAWLDKYGAPPASVEVSYTAPLETWARICKVLPDGSIMMPGCRYGVPDLRELLIQAVVDIARETGAVLDEVDAEVAGKCIDDYQFRVETYEAEQTRKIAEQGQKYLSGETCSPPCHLERLDEEMRAAIEAKKARIEQECKENHERREAEKQAAKDAYDAERAAWIETNGSRRLQLMLAEGIGLDQTYRDERLAAERPGWSWYEDICGMTTTIRDTSEAALDALLTARRELPEDENITLEWLRDAGHIDGCEHEEPEGEYRDTLAEFIPRPVLDTRFLGWSIIREID